MNYEQKYKEALECIQEILNSDNDMIMLSRLKLCLQPIFPELKESEDERICREIINALRSREEKTPTEWLDWLEKQGKNKEDIPIDCTIETKQPKYIDADEVISWLNDNWWYTLCEPKIKSKQIEKFKQYFDLC